MTGPTPDLAPHQALSLALSHHLLNECVLFCAVNGVTARGFDANALSTVAMTAAIIGLLAKNPKGRDVRLKIAESFVDGYAETLIEELLSVNKKGRHER